LIYYVARKGGDEPASLYRVPIMGGTPEKVKDDLDSPITFSPDGRKYAFVRESANESMLMVADPDSGREQMLITRKLPEVLDYPAWSPQGGTIACFNFRLGATSEISPGLVTVAVWSLVRVARRKRALVMCGLFHIPTAMCGQLQEG
jgi:hypothetical protein